jgi:hypothetical protein
LKFICCVFAFFCATGSKTGLFFRGLFWFVVLVCCFGLLFWFVVLVWVFSYDIVCCATGLTQIRTDWKTLLAAIKDGNDFLRGGNDFS